MHFDSPLKWLDFAKTTTCRPDWLQISTQNNYYRAVDGDIASFAFLQQSTLLIISFKYLTLEHVSEVQIPVPEDFDTIKVFHENTIVLSNPRKSRKIVTWDSKGEYIISPEIQLTTRIIMSCTSKYTCSLYATSQSGKSSYVLDVYDSVTAELRLSVPTPVVVTSCSLSAIEINDRHYFVVCGKGRCIILDVGTGELTFKGGSCDPCKGRDYTSVSKSYVIYPAASWKDNNQSFVAYNPYTVEERFFIVKADIAISNIVILEDGNKLWARISSRSGAMMMVKASLFKVNEAKSLYSLQHYVALGKPSSPKKSKIRTLAYIPYEIWKKGVLDTVVTGDTITLLTSGDHIELHTIKIENKKQRTVESYLNETDKKKKLEILDHLWIGDVNRLDGSTYAAFVKSLDNVGRKPWKQLAHDLKQLQETGTDMMIWVSGFSSRNAEEKKEDEKKFLDNLSYLRERKPLLELFGLIGVLNSHENEAPCLVPQTGVILREFVPNEPPATEKRQKLAHLTAFRPAQLIV